jgi:hypothetical protein
MDNHNAILYNQVRTQRLASRNATDRPPAPTTNPRPSPPSPRRVGPGTRYGRERACQCHRHGYVLMPCPRRCSSNLSVSGRPPPTHTSPAGPAGPRGPGQQPNGSGAPHPQMPGSAPPQQPHVPQPPSFNGVPPGQRPMSMNGPPQPQPPNGQQQRPVGTPNHNLPFQSPTMSHSPNGQQGPRPPSQQAPGPGPQGAPMANLNGPSPVMNRSMMPPNSIPQGLVMGGTPQPPQQGGPGPQGGNFGQMGGGRPPSRTNTPQMQPGMTHQSPSMGNRQPMPQLEAIESEFRQINPSLFPQLKQDASIPAEKNQNHFSYDDKVIFIQLCFLTSVTQRSFSAKSSTPTRCVTKVLEPLVVPVDRRLPCSTPSNDHPRISSSKVRHSKCGP